MFVNISIDSAILIISSIIIAVLCIIFAIHIDEKE